MALGVSPCLSVSICPGGGMGTAIQASHSYEVGEALKEPRNGATTLGLDTLTKFGNLLGNLKEAGR